MTECSAGSAAAAEVDAATAPPPICGDTAPRLHWPEHSAAAVKPGPACRLV
jgi:hypothetical protein